MVSDYQKNIIRQEKLIKHYESELAHLKEDLEFAVHINPTSNRTYADVADAYNFHSQQINMGIEETRVQDANGVIRRS